MPADGFRRHPHWIEFVRVDDVQATVAHALELGGRVLVAPYVDRHGGKMAVVSDPFGAPIGVLEWLAVSDAMGAK